MLTVIGSERARNAKTAGATLAEAGKINESLMYLGQCLQMQSNVQDGAKVEKPAISTLRYSTDIFMVDCTCAFPSMQAHGASFLQFIPHLQSNV